LFVAVSFVAVDEDRMVDPVVLIILVLLSVVVLIGAAYAWRRMMVKPVKQLRQLRLQEEQQQRQIDQAVASV